MWGGKAEVWGKTRELSPLGTSSHLTIIRVYCAGAFHSRGLPVVVIDYLRHTIGIRKQFLDLTNPGLLYAPFSLLNSMFPTLALLLRVANLQSRAIRLANFVYPRTSLSWWKLVPFRTVPTWVLASLWYYSPQLSSECASRFPLASTRRSR